MLSLLPTAYVLRREGSVLTCVCPSVCPHLGGYPSWGVPHLRYPLSDLAKGVPCWGVPHLGYPPVGPGQGVPLMEGCTLSGGTPAREVPHLRYPPVGPGQGVSLMEGCTLSGGTPAREVPHLGYPPVRPGQEGTPAGGTPPQVPPLSDLGVPLPWGGYPAGGYSTSRTHPCWTWLRGYPCWGDTPPLLSQTWLGGGTPPRVRDGVLDTPRSVCLLRPRRRTFLLFHLFRSGSFRRSILPPGAVWMEKTMLKNIGICFPQVKRKF